MFASTNISQARALSEILNENNIEFYGLTEQECNNLTKEEQNKIKECN